MARSGVRFTVPNNFDKMGDCVKRKMKNALRKAARRLAKYVRENCPVDTGQLRYSVTVEDTTVSVEAPYAEFVEFGTVKMAAQPFFWPAVERYRAEMHRDMQKVLQDCKDGKEDDREGEPDDDGGGAGGAVGGAVGAAISAGIGAIGEAGIALGTFGAEVAAEGAEMAAAAAVLL